MTGDDAGGVRAATLELVCAALRDGDPAPVAAVLAPDVVWFGAGPRGGCHSSAEVLAALGEAFAGGAARPQLHGARLHGDRAVLEVAWPDAADGPGRRWYVLSFGDGGLIERLQGYTDEAIVRHDLALRAAGPPEPPAGHAAPAVSALVSFVNVADMARSLAFYGLLGLEPVDVFAPHGETVWAHLRGGSASLMLARAGMPIVAREQGVIFYLYAHDLAGLRDHLVSHGVTVSQIGDGSPGPRREMALEDPDRYVLMIAQIEDDEPVR
jgi:catechol 2,3-dioxygenase-like lactoylglutathione lyase family enzyme